MERFVKTLLILAIIVAPIRSFGAEVKAFQHILSIYGDDKDGGLKMPEGVACDEKSNFVVADTGNGRLLKYTFQDDKLKGGAEIKVPEMSYPVRLQLSSKGEIFALDEKLRRLVKLSPEGTFAGYVEPEGVPAPDKIFPRSFKLDANNNLYILDIAGNRVLVLDPTGKYQRQIPLPQQKGFFSDLTVAGGGDIFLLDSTNPAVFIAAKGSAVFAPLTKDLKEYVSFPTYITSDNKGLLYLVDQNGDAIVTLGYDGSFQSRKLVMGWKDGQVNYPSQICLTGAGSVIYVTDRNNSKVQIFSIVK